VTDVRKTKTGSLDSNVAAMLCYLPVAGINLIASIAFLATEPKDNKLVRFHAIQALFLLGSVIVLGSCLGVCAGLLPVVAASVDDDLALAGSIGTIVFSLLFAFGALGTYALCMYQAHQSKIFRIPVIGQIADRMSD
jgi:uncharacterized membrane protein